MEDFSKIHAKCQNEFGLIPIVVSSITIDIPQESFHYVRMNM